VNISGKVYTSKKNTCDKSYETERVINEVPSTRCRSFFARCNVHRDSYYSYKNWIHGTFHYDYVLSL